jgi:hypothetical protein
MIQHLEGGLARHQVELTTGLVYRAIHKQAPEAIHTSLARSTRTLSAIRQLEPATPLVDRRQSPSSAFRCFLHRQSPHQIVFLHRPGNGPRNPCPASPVRRAHLLPRLRAGVRSSTHLPYRFVDVRWSRLARRASAIFALRSGSLPLACAFRNPSSAPGSLVYSL